MIRARQLSSRINAQRKSLKPIIGAHATTVQSIRTSTSAEDVHALDHRAAAMVAIIPPKLTPVSPTQRTFDATTPRERAARALRGLNFQTINTSTHRPRTHLYFSSADLKSITCDAKHYARQSPPLALITHASHRAATPPNRARQPAPFKPRAFEIIIAINRLAPRGRARGTTHLHADISSDFFCANVRHRTGRHRHRRARGE